MRRLRKSQILRWRKRKEGFAMKQLAKEAIKGNEDAFVQLIQENTQGMYKVARSILKNEEDIADALQDTIVTCYESIGKLKKPQYFKTWLTRILINKCNDIIRSQKKEWVGEVYAEDAGSTSDMEHFEFIQMLQGLDEKYRLIIILYYVQELRVKDIADLLQMNCATVKTRLVRGRKALEQMYGIDKKEIKHTENAMLFKMRT